MEKPRSWITQPETWIATWVLLMLLGHLVLRSFYGQVLLSERVRLSDVPLFAALLIGGTPLILKLLQKLVHLEFGADLLAGISIAASVWLGEYLAGTIIVLMLSGGATLEAVALARAGDALMAMAQRMPSIARRNTPAGPQTIPLESVVPGDELIVAPHEICPVDGVVLSGRGHMDESYLSGEPYVIPKLPGSDVLSGAINGETALVVRCIKPAKDSRFAQVQRVMEEGVQKRPQLRRLADQLGSWFTPIALVIAGLAWYISDDPIRFLSVLVIATPCPLLIAIPVAQVGAISLSAKRQILIRDPRVLERIEQCETAIFDKTGTLTTGHPSVTDVVANETHREIEIVQYAASLEQYSKHPLAAALIAHAREREIKLLEADEVSEPPGQGLTGLVAGHHVQVTGRRLWLNEHSQDAIRLPDRMLGLECIIAIDHEYAGLIRFRDTPRVETANLLQHLGPRHGLRRRILLTGDRREEAEAVGKSLRLEEIVWDQTPEQKLAFVQKESSLAPTLYVGDGINDAPAMTAATVAIAIGGGAVAGQAAGAVLLDGRLHRLDELMHIGKHMRKVAVQCAIGGMGLSAIGMAIAATGYMSPIVGALAQEFIDLFAVLWALRAARPPQPLTDFDM